MQGMGSRCLKHLWTGRLEPLDKLHVSDFTVFLWNFSCLPYTSGRLGLSRDREAVRTWHGQPARRLVRRRPGDGGNLREGWSCTCFGKISGHGQDIHVTSEERLARGSEYPDVDKMAMPPRKSDNAAVPSGFTIISAASSVLNSASIG